MAMSGLGADVRYALRALRRRPLLVVVAVAVLAVGIGAGTAVFSVVDAVLLRPLPFADPGRLVVAWQRSPDNSVPFIEVSYPDYLDWRAQARSFESMAIIPTVNQGFMVAGDEPVQVQGRLVSGNFFDVLGAQALIGRTLRPDDDRAGASRVVVLGHGLWQRQYGADPAVLGRKIVVDGTPMEVVGVMPRAFRYPPKVEMWTPVVPAIPEIVTSRDVYWAIVVGRLARGARLAQAEAELDGIVDRIAKASPRVVATAAVVTPLTDDLFGPSRPALLVLLAAVLLVLLVACANVSALLLARAADRQREIAVRLALGASRRRLVRQLLCESALITSGAVAGGVLLAQASLHSLLALVPADVPRLQDAAIDGRVLAFTVVLAAAAALLSGLAPAVLASRPSLGDALEGGARTAGPGGSAQRRWQGLLVGAEAAVALVLLTGAGLTTQTFQNLRRLDLGYDPRQVLALEVAVPHGKYKKPSEWRSLYAGLMERIDRLPGVEASGGVFLRPLWGQMGNDWYFTAEGQSDEESRRNPHVNLEAVTPGYFAAMRTPLLRGRDFTERDAEGAPGVAILSDGFARRYWPGQDPIGKRLKIPLPGSPYHDTWLTVVGVVADARYREIQASRMAPRAIRWPSPIRCAPPSVSRTATCSPRTSLRWSRSWPPRWAGRASACSSFPPSRSPRWPWPPSAPTARWRSSWGGARGRSACAWPWARVPPTCNSSSSGRACVRSWPVSRWASPDRSPSAGACRRCSSASPPTTRSRWPAPRPCWRRRRPWPATFPPAGPRASIPPRPCGGIESGP
ncbi:MAG: permease [Acidobacteria bacterium]|nr:MAG: permease [Acidobacteriota bacterium]